MKRVFWGVGAFLLGLCSLGFMVYANDADECIYSCSTFETCNITDQPCPNCDPGLGVECSDYIHVKYNPAKAVINRTDIGKNSNQKRVSLGEVICFKTAHCGNASTLWGYGCYGNDCYAPSPTWCVKCTTVGAWVNSYVINFRCDDCPS